MSYLEIDLNLLGGPDSGTVPQAALEFPIDQDDGVGLPGPVARSSV